MKRFLYEKLLFEKESITPLQSVREKTDFNQCTQNVTCVCSVMIGINIDPSL